MSKIHGYIVFTLILVGVVHYFYEFFKIVKMSFHDKLELKNVIKERRIRQVLFSGKFIKPFIIIAAYIILIFVYVLIFF